jgi:hypothetical protein
MLLLRDNILQVSQLRMQNKDSDMNKKNVMNEKHEENKRSAGRILHEKIRGNGHRGHPT